MGKGTFAGFMKHAWLRVSRRLTLPVAFRYKALGLPRSLWETPEPRDWPLTWPGAVRCGLAARNALSGPRVVLPLGALPSAAEPKSRATVYR